MPSSSQVSVEALAHQEESQKPESDSEDSVELDAKDAVITQPNDESATHLGAVSDSVSPLDDSDIHDDLGSSGDSFEDIGTVRNTLSGASHLSTMAPSSITTPPISDKVDTRADRSTSPDDVPVRVSKRSSPIKGKGDSMMDIEILSSPSKSEKDKLELEKEAKEKEQKREREYLKACRREEKYQGILQGCQIMVLDSLGNSHATAIKNIKEYLLKEALHKKGVMLHERAGGHNPKVNSL